MPNVVTAVLDGGLDERGKVQRDAGVEAPQAEVREWHG